MASLEYQLVAIAAVVFPSALLGHAALLGNNPALGVFQNEGNCFPVKETWYITQRNYEIDPYFGILPACTTISAAWPFSNNTGKFKVQVGTLPIYVTITLMSSPGYTVKNVLNVRPDLLPRIIPSLNVTSLYADCSACKVMRHNYIQRGKGCSLWRPESALDRKDQCCDFAYDLLCGPSPKYQLYDKC
ncbi:uncharacterized protein LOC144165101 [Haemaphysalis longicornis]